MNERVAARSLADRRDPFSPMAAGVALAVAGLALIAADHAVPHHIPETGLERVTYFGCRSGTTQTPADP